jgi:hypothetical protein
MPPGRGRPTPSAGPGVWTYSFTANLSPDAYTVYAQATDSDGAVGDPVALSLTVQ